MTPCRNSTTTVPSSRILKKKIRIRRRRGSSRARDVIWYCIRARPCAAVCRRVLCLNVGPVAAGCTRTRYHTLRSGTDFVGRFRCTTNSAGPLRYATLRTNIFFSVSRRLFRTYTRTCVIVTDRLPFHRQTENNADIINYAATVGTDLESRYRSDYLRATYGDFRKIP